MTTQDNNRELSELLGDYMLEVTKVALTGGRHEVVRMKLARIRDIYLADIEALTAKRKAARIESSKSLCGCPMCEHHTYAYKATTSEQEEAEND